MTIASKRLRIILAAIPVLLFIPLFAMQFTDEVNWAIGDFLMMGVLLLGFGLLLELCIRRINKRQYHKWVYAGIVLLFLLSWAELAVGIFGTPFAGS